MKEVKVVIPVYRPVLTNAERASVAQTVRILGKYPLVLLCPENMDASAITGEFPMLEPLAVSGEWLGLKNGLAGYNRMMLSAAFYDLFIETDYILICHTDAWIFRDELPAWCSRKYDCVAAPWLRRPVYDLPLVKQWLSLRKKWAAQQGKPLRQSLYGRVGNGGLSLRRVAAFRTACDTYRKQIETFAATPGHLFNEDVFWALVPTEFRYPSWRDALAFAFDTNPAHAFKLCGGQTPFGCHGWSKPRMWRFWRRIIPVKDIG